MTRRSRIGFWGLTSVLALLLISAATVVGYRAWQVERARKALKQRQIAVWFLYDGPAWAQDYLPVSVAHAWFSKTDVSESAMTYPGGVTNESRWEAALLDLQHIPAVVSIRVTSWGISKKAVRAFHEFPRLRRLVLDSGDLGNEHLELLSQCTQLNSLQLPGTKITDDGLRHLAGLTNLRELNLSHTHVSDDGLAHLVGLHNLRVLYLDGTRVTADGLVHLQQLKKLTDLSLVNTGMPDSALSVLEADLPDLMISDD